MRNEPWMCSEAEQEKIIMALYLCEAIAEQRESDVCLTKDLRAIPIRNVPKAHLMHVVEVYRCNSQ